MNRSQELLDTVDSEFAFKTWKHDMETKTRTVAENLQQVIKSSDTSISNTYNIFRLPYNFDPLVVSRYTYGFTCYTAEVRICQRVRSLHGDDATRYGSPQRD